MMRAGASCSAAVAAVDGTEEETQMDHEDSQPAAEQAAKDDETAIRHVQTAPIHKDTNGTYRVVVTAAVRMAGLGQGALFRYIPEEVDNLGVVPALGSEDGEGSLRDQRTYTVEKTATALRLTIPRAALDALGIDTEAIPDPGADHNEQPPLVDVFAGDRMIAFDASSGISLGDVLPDEYAAENAPDADEVILDQIQTTTPRLRKTSVTAAVSPALRHAGNRTGSIEYRPDLADELGGIVPAILHEERTGGQGEENTRKVYREGEEREDLVISLPEDVLDALDLSTADFEDVPREERPSIAVYAGDGIVAFARPGEHKVAVDRTQTPSNPDPSLLGVAGIGVALADRLSDRGYETIEDLATATREELLSIDNLGEKRADRIMADVASRTEGEGE
jgi:hypothetical protein